MQLPQKGAQDQRSRTEPRIQPTGIPSVHLRQGPRKKGCWETWTPRNTRRAAHTARETDLIPSLIHQAVPGSPEGVPPSPQPSVARREPVPIFPHFSFLFSHLFLAASPASSVPPAPVRVDAAPRCPEAETPASPKETKLGSAGTLTLTRSPGGA